MEGALLIFDGDCGFCTASANWIERHWTRPARAVPWQRLGSEGLVRLGLTERQVSEQVYWVDARGRSSGGAEAVGHALAESGHGWRIAGRLLLLPPVLWAARPCYRLVSRYRYKLPGATPACKV